MPIDGTPVRLAVAIHNHQPVGNFDSVFAEAVERAYRPFLDALVRHPGVRLSMHWSGPLFEWLEEHEPSILDALGMLCARGQVELLSGAFYEPILAVIPPWDQQGQIERMNGYLKARFGVTARGAWLAERVWEPDLPDVLARAGIEYTLVDDHHFLLAGEQGHLSVSEGQSFEDVVRGGHHVEELVIARPVEDRFAVAGRLDRDRLLGRPLQ